MSGVNPDFAAPGDPTGQRVTPIGMSPELPVVQADSSKYYWCTVPAASMHRTDGKKLAFLFKFLETDDLEDQKYLDKEIAARNPYLREATEDEIQANRMRVNPRATIKAEVTAEIEASLRERLEQEILDALSKKGIDVSSVVTDEGKLQNSEALARQSEVIAQGIRSGSGTLVQASITGSSDLGGIAASGTAPVAVASVPGKG